MFRSISIELHTASINTKSMVLEKVNTIIFIFTMMAKCDENDGASVDVPQM